jgi:hypothetical protein
MLCNILNWGIMMYRAAVDLYAGLRSEAKIMLEEKTVAWQICVLYLDKLGENLKVEI